MPPISVVQGDFAFVAHGGTAPTTWDISDPTAWSQIHSGTGLPVTSGMYLAGDLLFTVGGNGSGLSIIDVSNPASPSVTGFFGGLTGPYDVCVAGNYAYVADPYGDDLTIVDISNPSAPSLKGSYEWGMFVRSITVKGDLAFLAGDTGGLRIADISDASNPTPLGFYNTTERAFHVEVDGDYAYVANQLSGLYVLDISNPANPVLADHYDTPGSAMHVTRHGDYLFLADQIGGMSVFRSFIGAFDECNDTARSIILDTTDETIRLVCVQVERTGSVSFELSADGGASWESVPMEYYSASRSIDKMPAAWHFLTNPGQDLIWRAVLNYQHNGINPTLDYLRIDYSSEVATLLQDYSAKVIGESVEIEWRLSHLDEGIEFTVSRIDADNDTPLFLDSSGILRDDLTFRFTDDKAAPGTECRYRVEYTDGSASRTLFETVLLKVPDLPVTLFQNTPNPFNPSTSIRFYLPERSAVRLEIFDAAGRLVRTLIDGDRERGYTEASWDGTGNGGRATASGIYFCRLRAGKQNITRKMVLIR